VRCRHILQVTALLLGLAARAYAAGSCQVMVASRPKGATVYIDGKERGKTPLVLMDLKSGHHDIRVVLEGHKTWMKRARLRRGGNSIEAKLEEKGAPLPSGSKQPGKHGGAPSEPGDAQPDAGGEKGGDDKAEEKVPRKHDVPCPCCEGKGVIDEIGCEKCFGIGYVGTTPCSGCTGGRKPYECPACQGKGNVSVRGEDVECRVCRGKGAPLCPMCKGKGKVSRPNPDAVDYETTVCVSCGGEGWERNLKCRKCTGKGTIALRSSDATYVYTLEISCPHCKGSGKAAPRCSSCNGAGFRRAGGKICPCMKCFGTGHLFIPCRTCGGKGWHKAR